ncbi:MAG: GNAT family N-acetyltransferase [Bdellovibrionaceae bacterium]|nr:GNAT family N-acetyltransferase [Pseudobdellovibrionaceae bacterium]
MASIIKILIISIVTLIEFNVSFGATEKSDMFEESNKSYPASSQCDLNLRRLVIKTQSGVLNQKIALAMSYFFPAIGNLESVYKEKIKGKVTDDKDIFELISDALEIKFEFESNFESQIPKDGSFITVVNNSNGWANTLGAVMGLRRVRKDVKIIGNEVLLNLPEIRPHLIPFDMWDADLSYLRSSKNKYSMELALEHIQSGGVLVILPGEEVASTKYVLGRAFESEWKEQYGNLIERAKVPVLPVYVKAQTRTRFNFLSLFGGVFRYSALASELKALSGKNFQVKLGNVLLPENLAVHYKHSDRLIDAIRTHNLLLGGDDEVIVGAFSRYFTRYKRRLTQSKKTQLTDFLKPIVTPIDKEELAAEIASLPKDALLQEIVGKQFFLIKKKQAEKVVFEIGRLREEVFRAENEGTGNEIDLDKYDEDYYHLFVWDVKEKEIIGSYRLGLGDELLSKNGIDGLYTKSLFNYDEKFLGTLGSVLELGRSFIIPKHRKRLLPYIFMAITKVLVKFPHIDALIGPVSISGDRSLVSMLVTTEYLKHNFKAQSEQSKLLHPPHPFSVKTQFTPESMLNFLETIGDLRELGKYVQSLEGNKELPPLVSIYAELGAMFFSFNVDYDFNRAVDGMIVVFPDNFSEKNFNNLFRGHEEEYKRLRAKIWQDRLNNN